MVPWASDTNIYEINLRQYTPEGTFNAFIHHLPRLRDMAVEILWFMPITPISFEKRQGTLGSYYACSDYTSVNPEFGSLEDFIKLVEEAHGMGFKVIIDWVANHTGWDHHWTKEHPDYYLRDSSGNFYDAHGWHDVIDLNYYNVNLRKAMVDAMKFWIYECGIDGFRCDMAHLVPLDFWRDARKELDAITPLFWLAECEVPAYHEVFDASYTWHWMHSKAKFYKGELNLVGLGSVLMEYNNSFPPTALRLYFTSNHDENSWNGTEYEKYGEAAIPLAVFSCTWNSVPLIYSGQEMPNKKRLKFFDKDPIGWTGEFKLHNFYKTLLTLRKRNSALRAGDISAITLRLHTSAEEQLFAFLRKNDENEVVAILNLSDMSLNFRVTDLFIEGNFTDVFTQKVITLNPDTALSLNPWSFFVFEK